MTAKSFADSNVVLYTIGKDARKAAIAPKLLADSQAVSVQVVNECVSVCLRKLSFTREQAYAFARTLMDRTEVVSMDESTLDQAAALGIRYQLSHGDALIAAAALLAGCETLYSEDMQDGLVIEARLTVVNPFKETVIAQNAPAPKG
jgi:predicted nucleic acid-binding protein